MPALQASLARERERRCVATEMVQELGYSPDQRRVQDCRAQHSLAISGDKRWALHAVQSQNFDLILSIAEVPPNALLWNVCKVTDVTFHIRREVVLWLWPRLCAQHSQDFLNLFCPLLKHILIHHYVFRSVNGPLLSSISAEKVYSRLFEMSLNLGPPRESWKRTVHVRDDSGFAPILLLSPPIHRHRRR